MVVFNNQHPFILAHLCHGLSMSFCDPLMSVVIVRAPFFSQHSSRRVPQGLSLHLPSLPLVKFDPMKTLFLEIGRSVEVNVHKGQLFDINMTIRCSSQDQIGSHEGLNGVHQKSIISKI